MNAIRTERVGQRVSNLYGMTLREAPAEAEIESHKLLVRAGYVRQVAAGIFSYLPLAWRSLRKIEQILREEMDRIDGQELSMPVVHPAELWQATGRWHDIDATMARFVDRRDRDMLLAMTHEEVVAFHAASEIQSYRQLPAMVYHMQTKFRDELRSRGGLIRVREFTMKDSYSLDRDAEGLERQYERHYEAYERIGRRCGLPLTAVMSDTGMMGGKIAHEFMYVTPIGEDSLALCDACGYAANREVAEFTLPPAHENGGSGADAAGGSADAAGGSADAAGGSADDGSTERGETTGGLTPATGEPQRVHTPGTKTIEAVSELLGVPPQATAKMVFYVGSFSGDGGESGHGVGEDGAGAGRGSADSAGDGSGADRGGADSAGDGSGTERGSADGVGDASGAGRAAADKAGDGSERAGGGRREKVIAAVVRGDLEANPIQVQNLAGALDLRPADEEEIAATGMVPGFASPVGIDPDAAIFVVDHWVAAGAGLVLGANEGDYHLTDVRCGRDYQPTHVGPVAMAFEGAPCARCGEGLRMARGVEVGNIFQLGTRYSKALDATFSDEDGVERPIWMGSYGIGTGRLLACVAEEHRDDYGLKLPASVAPYHVALVSLAREEEARTAADRVFEQLCAAGVEVLYDDRPDLRAGVKFNDADLRGLPLRIVIGERSLAQGGAELSHRGSRESQIVPLDDLAPHLQSEITTLMQPLLP